MGNLFQGSVDEHILHSLGDDVVFHIGGFMDPIDASILCKRFLNDVEQRAADALQLITERMTHIMDDDNYMSRLTEAALEQCKIPRVRRPPLPRRLLLIVSRRIFVRVVTGAGAPEVNGVYTQSHYFEDACMYTREGKWKNVDCMFHIYQCEVSDNTKHWFISIVPRHSTPGTTDEIDFYSSPVTADCLLIPPIHGWVKAFFGVDPPPTLSYMHPYNEQDHRRRLEGKEVAQIFIDNDEDGYTAQFMDDNDKDTVVPQRTTTTVTARVNDNNETTMTILQQENAQLRSDLDALRKKFDELKRESSSNNSPRQYYTNMLLVVLVVMLLSTT